MHLCFPKLPQSYTTAMEGQPITAQPSMNTTNPIGDFDHINLNEIDDSYKPVDANVYTLEVSRLEPVYRTIKKPDSEYVNQSVLVLRGAYRIVEDEKYSGRLLFQDFWTPFNGAKIGMKRLSQATGVTQADGQTLSEWAAQFAQTNPAARFQVPVLKQGKKNNPEEAENQIDFFNAKPI